MPLYILSMWKNNKNDDFKLSKSSSTKLNSISFFILLGNLLSSDEDDEGNSSILPDLVAKLRLDIPKLSDIPKEPAPSSTPQHACRYCLVQHPNCVSCCYTCKKWFCNGKGGKTKGSHIVEHLARSKHKEIALHADNNLGDTVLECYNCGARNVFILGYVPSREEDSVVVILCRQPCAVGLSGKEDDGGWDAARWKPIIENKTFIDWIISPPKTEEEMKGSREITYGQIVRLEEMWKVKSDATLAESEARELEEHVEPVRLRYLTAQEYCSIMAPLIKLEADYDKSLKESQKLTEILVQWETGLNQRKLANFTLPNVEEFRIVPGDEVIVSHQLSKWSALGNVLRTGFSGNEGITVELRKSQSVPTDRTGYSVEFVWKSTSYDRMADALKKLDQPKFIDRFIFQKLMGHEVESPILAINLPFKQINAPGLPELNHSQVHAMKSVLQRPLALIQGPPGTGKTVTTATIVYQLAMLNQGPILVTAPSNVAVDQLCEKIEATNLRVVRLSAKWREDLSTNVSHLSLHEQVRNNDTRPELQKLFQLREERKELSKKDEDRFLNLRAQAEQEILKAAQIICATCVGSGDKRLSGFKFRAVLIDEATQATEPEALISVMHGAPQVILIGDHRQLGPVVLCKKAAKAGYNQSLFERLINLGLRPNRLQVQYRMHPCLSAFPSNCFYEGSLQNGVSAFDRLRSIDFPWPNPDNPMFFMASYGSEEISSSGTSFLNRTESLNCEAIVSRLIRCSIDPEKIGVITPYDGQRAYIQQYMQNNGSLATDFYKAVEVASVDAFQGREKDYIILSCVRSNDHGGIGFLSDARRLNVALTRAKYGLVILGNPKVLAKNFIWNQLLQMFKEKHLLMDGSLTTLHHSVVSLPNPKPQSPLNTTLGHRIEAREYYGKLPSPQAAVMNRPFYGLQINEETLSQTSLEFSLKSIDQYSELFRNDNDKNSTVSTTSPTINTTKNATSNQFTDDLE